MAQETSLGRNEITQQLKLVNIPISSVSVSKILKEIGWQNT